MPRVAANGIELEYDTTGSPTDAPLLLVAGLAAQMVWWEEDLCEALADRGFYVIRFDNRDCGRSTVLEGVEVDVVAEVARIMGGGQGRAPYRLSTLADDAWGLLDALGIDQAHLCGASMGGMVAQEMAIGDPDRVLSLTSIMSMTGDPDVGWPDPQALGAVLEAPRADRDGYVEDVVRASQLVAGEEWFEEDRVRRRAERYWERGSHPGGAARQIVAILASGSRSEGLRRLDLPAMVIHGDADPLVTLSGGERTAECLRGSELVIFEGVGHDLPSPLWPRVVDAIVSVAARGERERRRPAPAG